MATRWANRSWWIHASAPLGEEPTARSPISAHGAAAAAVAASSVVSRHCVQATSSWRAVRAGSLSRAAHAAGGRVAHVHWPRAPVRAVLVGQRVVDAEQRQVVALHGRPAAPPLVIPLGLEHLRDRMALGGPHGVVVDPPAGRVVDRDGRRPADREQQRIEPASRARVVRRGLLGQRGRGGVQRAEQEGGATASGERRTEIGDVVQIADAPAVAPPQGVHLDGGAPAGRRRRAGGGVDDEPGRRPTVDRVQPVVPGRHVAVERVDDASVGSVLEHQPARPAQPVTACRRRRTTPGRRGSGSPIAARSAALVPSGVGCYSPSTSQ